MLAIAAGAAVLLMAFSWRNGYHRDELYFLEASRHMAWGFVDQPPGSVAFVWLSRMLFGDSLVGLRLFPALAFAAAVALTGLIARELGGRRFPQILAALSLAVSLFLAAGHLAGPTVYDLVAWTLVSLLVMRILRTGRQRLWLVVGLVVGLSLLNKETILFLVIGLVIGFVVSRQTAVLKSPWLWAAAGLALLIWTPVIVWEAQHSWATLEMSASLRREHSGVGVSLIFPFFQLILPGLWTAPIWISGLWLLWHDRRYRAYRAFAVAYVVLFVLVGLLIGDRPYYIGPLLFVLLAAGAIATEGVVDGTRRFFSQRRPSRRLVWRSRRAAVVFVLVPGLLTLPISLPVLPPGALARVPLQNINYNLGEEIGWQQLVGQVATVYRSLPPAERSSVAIVTGNYGEAGAIDRYGPALGLPTAYSGHNNFWWWGPPRPSLGMAIVVGYTDRASTLLRYFTSVSLAGRVHNRWGVANDEEGVPIWLCRGQRQPWPVIWPQFKSYG